MQRFTTESIRKTSLAATSGLQFPVCQIAASMAAHTGRVVSSGAATYLAGVVEYLTAEVMELAAVEGSKVVKAPLKEQTFPNGAIIGAVVRKGEVTIPDGNFQIQPGDSVVLFVLPQAIKQTMKLFSKGRFA